MDEQNLLSRLRHGDEQALAAAITQYSAYVVTVIHNRSRGLLSPEDEDELASSVFFTLWQSCRTVKSGHLRAWLGSVARNKTVDRLRRARMDMPLDEELAALPVDAGMDPDEENGWMTRWVNDKGSMLRANFPGESLQAVAKHLADQHNPVAYVKSLDFAPEYVSCEYHTAYSNPGFIAKLQAMGVKVALWTVDTEDAVRSLLPLGPDCLVTNRPDRVREWVEENQ